MNQEATNQITITKVTLTGFKEDLLLRQQMCGLELGFSEENLWTGTIQPFDGKELKTLAKLF